MDDQTIDSRLTRISTIWTMLARAHEGGDAQAAAARLAFIQRYQRAAYRYLLGAVRDADAADELFQELAYRFVRGDFRRADPAKGRFRDYLKTALSHLVADYYRQRGRQPIQLDLMLAPVADQEGSQPEQDPFDNDWRDELLGRAWTRLEQLEANGGQPYYSVLRLRTENARVTSAEMAIRLTNQLSRKQPFTDAGVRKLLQRARTQFADQLLDEVARSLQHPSNEEIEHELVDLDLLRYCQSALARRREAEA